MQLTIVIATFNASAFLPATLASLASQRTDALAKCEVIIVDGKSGDSTLEIAKSSPVVSRIICEPDDGIYDAMNKGAKHARGAWLHFLNAGDVLADSESLSSTLTALTRADKDAHFWMVGGANNLGGGAGAPRKIPNLPHIWWKHALGLQPHCHQATWVRSDLFRAMGGYSLDFGLAGDFDLILRMGLLGRPFEEHSLLIGYLGGGVSEKEAHLMPQLLHRVRSERLNLTGMALAGDRLVSRIVVLRNRTKIRLGAMRRKSPLTHSA
ncbi:glycosyltransferase family 2 protein [Okibacterium sp. HSC-33S16]|uniref:glycosyltransferase family 2 protein n=1 Tax=Okibacterium sp. HSC-33S16 TaxID=2910965 RepID=UPI0021129898|nr:glycosyltransferase family 2 protein [Okibacterium sp. HSC-33S16]